MFIPRKVTPGRPAYTPALYQIRPAIIISRFFCPLVSEFGPGFDEGATKSHNYIDETNLFLHEANKLIITHKTEQIDCYQHNTDFSDVTHPIIPPPDLNSVPSDPSDPLEIGPELTVN